MDILSDADLMAGLNAIPTDFEFFLTIQAIVLSLTNEVVAQ